MTEARPSLRAKRSNPRSTETVFFDQVVLRANGPVLVEFYTDSCASCKSYASTLEQFARKNRWSVTVVKVNANLSPQMAKYCGLYGVPSVLLFRNGHMVTEPRGAPSAPELEEMLATPFDETKMKPQGIAKVPVSIGFLVLVAGLVLLLRGKNGPKRETGVECENWA